MSGLLVLRDAALSARYLRLSPQIMMLSFVLPAGVKANTGGLIITTPLTEVGNEYLTYRKHMAGMAEWVQLQISVRPLEQEEKGAVVDIHGLCSICLQLMREGDSVITLSCNPEHRFHTSCLQE